MIIITWEDSIYQLVSEYPQIKDILFEMGFKDIIKPGMLQTVGKIMNLKKGATVKNIDLDVIINKFNEAGFSIT